MKHEKSLIARNLAWFIARHKTNSHALAEALARWAKHRGEKVATQATIFRILSGESKDPRTSTLQPLADFFGVSVSSLREYDYQNSGLSDDGRSTGNGNTVRRPGVQAAGMIYPLLTWEQASRQDSPRRAARSGLKGKARGKGASRKPPVPAALSEPEAPYGNMGSAGSAGNAGSTASDDGGPIGLSALSDLHKPQVDMGRRGYCVRVDGTAMIAEPGGWPSFPEGVMLYVNPDLPPKPGHFVVVRRARARRAIFRRLVAGDGELYLQALNPAWPDRVIKLSDADRFCGVVVYAGVALV